MRKLFNEFGISLVLGSGNWILCSHEIEDGEDEVRSWWIAFSKWRIYEGIYLRIWIWKTVFSLSKEKGFRIAKKPKVGLKCILWFQYSLN